jgi:hypothetical protein
MGQLIKPKDGCAHNFCMQTDEGWRCCYCGLEKNVYERAERARIIQKAYGKTAQAPLSPAEQLEGYFMGGTAALVAVGSSSSSSSNNSLPALPASIAEAKASSSRISSPALPTSALSVSRRWRKRRRKIAPSVKCWKR